MIFRKFFDPESFTCSYLLADREGGEALIIDPVRDRLADYLQAIDGLRLKLVRAIDTHLHADHITALGSLRECTGCITLMGEYTRAQCVSARVHEGETLAVGDLRLAAWYTPGHTDESFSFVLDPESPKMVFSGDVLLIDGSGRTDFQGGDAHKSWHSVVEQLFRLPDATEVRPGHDYRGRESSTIGEQRAGNPRFAGRSEAEYVALMNSLNLPNPRLMDIALPANLACGSV